jgi:N-acetylglucosaminyldiphosphoundecaprenol N-acetyl-beta-D-mannosaminyltransferase
VTGARISRFPVGGLGISELTFDEALALFLEAPARGDRLRAHFCTAHTVVEAHDTLNLRRALGAAELTVADGMALVWMGRLRGRHVGRVCGPDLMLALLDRSRQQGGRHYFYGGAPGIAERIAERMRERFPGLQIVGTEAPPFRPLTPQEQREAAERINASGADYVWVGLGTPKQDYWLAENRERLQASVLFAVGAAFDFLSGGKPRAPLLMQRMGTEWLFRLVTEPRRLGRRYTVTNARFLWLVGAEILRRPRRAGGARGS